jgi:hypothetical protein
MKFKFSKLLNEPLVWKSDGLFKTSQTLYHNDEPIAHFRQEDGILKSDASIYVAGAEEPLFIFRPKGFINTRVDVESDDIDFEVAKLKPLKWGGGITITFLNGNEYLWKSANMWGHTWLLKTADDLKIAKLELETWGRYGTITIVSDAPPPAELNLLIFAGWTQYLFELQAAAG